MTATRPLPEYYPGGDSRLASFLAPRPRWNPWQQLADEHPEYTVSDVHQLFTEEANPGALLQRGETNRAVQIADPARAAVHAGARAGAHRARTSSLEP
ncbi:hypothetical protein [Mycobacterium sp. 23]|uniref:hypothetical protein n=1 Tax=Mycobacterium sp. 23 TaxID=3400424 RepID=UPI003AADA41D